MSKIWEPNELDKKWKKVSFNHPQKGFMLRRLYHQKKCNVYYIWVDRMRWQVMSYNLDDTVCIG